MPLAEAQQTAALPSPGRCRPAKSSRCFGLAGASATALLVTSFADAQHLPSNCGGAEMHQLYLKQL
eukprot:14435672-Alexandrium_andersonii.AAC.1